MGYPRIAPCCLQLPSNCHSSGFAISCLEGASGGQKDIADGLFCLQLQFSPGNRWPLTIWKPPQLHRSFCRTGVPDHTMTFFSFQGVPAFWRQRPPLWNLMPLAFKIVTLPTSQQLRRYLFCTISNFRTLVSSYHLAVTGAVPSGNQAMAGAVEHVLL